MDKERIYILSGEINSGKTSALQNWINRKQDVYGILTPKVEGRRCFQNVETSDQFQMEASDGETNVLQIGKYTFSKMHFEKASSIVLNALQKPRGWLVVDEVGPLELQQKGFYKVVNVIVDNKNKELRKVLVVRSNLVDDVISFFKIGKAEIVTDLSALT